MKNIAILGSTGSVGLSALNVVKANKYNVKLLSAYNNYKLLKKQKNQFYADRAILVSDKIKCPYDDIEIGMNALIDALLEEDIDIVVVAISGLQAIMPIMAAINAGIDIAIANKESIVSAGKIIMSAVKENDINLIPIDSEHNAIFQCLGGTLDAKNISKIILPCSGGPFINFNISKLKDISVNDALKHPKWKMGKKISIDSSTLMNKALEVIEAFFLFDVSNIDVVIHPECIVHGMIEFSNGSIISHLGDTTMEAPIHYALSYPEIKEYHKKIDLTEIKTLSFSKFDNNLFPAIDISKEALRVGKSMPCFINSVNEILVERFLHGKISWLDIIGKLEKAISLHNLVDIDSIEDVFEVDLDARNLARSL